MAYRSKYQEDSDADADDEYERSVIQSPTLPIDYHESSPTDSGTHSTEHTPTTFTHSRDGKLTPTGLITEWTEEQTADFIADLGLDQYADTFSQESITGEALVALQHAELKEMGMNSVGHRLTVLKAVYDIKVKQNVPIEPDHYVPLSADTSGQDAPPTQDDFAKVIRVVQARDERIQIAESELRHLKDDLGRALEENKRLRDEVLEETRRLREEFLSIARQWKDSQHPLPKPHAEHVTSPPSEQRSGGSTLSPSIPGGQQMSPSTQPQPSPTSPYRERGYNPSRGAHPEHDSTTWSNTNTWTSDRDPRSNRPPRNGPTMSSADDPPLSGGTMNVSNTPSVAQTPPSNQEKAPQVEIFKSFRVSIDDPCHKVLPVALKKYNITADWRQYALYIVHGDQERCLGLNERPLILFKQLDKEGRKPMFMLRKHAAPAEGHVSTVGGNDIRSVGTGTGFGWEGQNRGVQLPGGVL